jgi:TPR repeat protein
MTALQRTSLVPLLAVLAIVGYFVGLYAERQKSQDPSVRLEVALQAFQEGYDDTALYLLTPLADGGNAMAQYGLADMYQYGLGVRRDSHKAIELLTKAASQGFIPAEQRLGEIYLHGRLVLQDVTLAREWLRKAAVAGDDSAQYELTGIYEHGLGVQADPVEAYAWAAVAAAHGNALAQRERDHILTGLSAEQAAKAELRAQEINGSAQQPVGAGVKADASSPNPPAATIHRTVDLARP